MRLSRTWLDARVNRLHSYVPMSKQKFATVPSRHMLGMLVFVHNPQMLSNTSLKAVTDLPWQEKVPTIAGAVDH